MTHLNITLNNTNTESVSLTNLIPTLYNIALEDTSGNNVSLAGRIEVVNAIKKLVEYLTARYTDLFITKTGEWYIGFDDPVCELIILNKLGLTGGLTETAAAGFTAVTRQEQISMFKGNTSLRVLDMRPFTISSVGSGKYGFLVYDYVGESTPISLRGYSLEEVYLKTGSSNLIGLNCVVFIYDSSVSNWSPMNNSQQYGTVTLPKFWCQGGVLTGESYPPFHGLYVEDCYADVNQVANDAFKCGFITRLILPKLSVVDGDSSVSGTYNNTNYIGDVYVPDSLVSSYLSANNWSNMSSRIHPISEYDQQYGTWYKNN